MWRTPQDGISTISPKRSDVAYSKDEYSVKASLVALDEYEEFISPSLELGSNARRNRRTLRKLFDWPTPKEYPLFVYYQQSRNFYTDERNDSRHVVSEEDLRGQSLSDDLRAIPDLSVWLDKLDAQEARRYRDEGGRYRDPQLQAVRRLIKGIEGFRQIGIDPFREENVVYITKSDGTKVYVDQLSSGERVYLILLVDLARRLQSIAPKKRLRSIPGIVLIDEIELNLHPEWQRKIIPALTTAFPKCQFVITTHSPQVLGEINSENIVILAKAKDGATERLKLHEETFGRDSNELLVKVLGGSERNTEIKLQLEVLEALISRDEFESAEQALEKLRFSMGKYSLELEIANDRLQRRRRSKNIEVIK